jgi:uncharacterized protein
MFCIVRRPLVVPRFAFCMVSFVLLPSPFSLLPFAFLIYPAFMSPTSRIVLAGGTGFLGRALAEALRRAGHDVVVLTRQPPLASVAAPTGTSAARTDAAGGPPAGIRRAHWTPDGTAGEWTALLEGARAVVNLAGESIGGGRWTAARKQRLRDSRLAATASLVSAIRGCRQPPDVFVSASAVGYYGLRGDEVLGEDAPPGDDFLARLCVDWERAALDARDATRVVLPRSGLVLNAKEGALPRMLVPFRFFVGGPIGSGRQYMSWIHLDDWVALLQWALDEGQLSGAVNASTNQPVTNEVFAATAGALLHRPALMRAPAFAVRALVGEMGDALVLGGQRVVPRRALELGFRFRYPEFKGALEEVLASR